MIVEWTDDLSIDIPIVDRQHKEIFECLNTLYNAIQSQSSEKDVATSIHFLENYVKRHFNAEEWSMRSSNYPGFQSHKMQHDAFVANVNRMKELWIESEDKNEIAQKLHSVGIKWLNEHIKKTDQAYGDFLRHRRENE